MLPLSAVLVQVLIFSKWRLSRGLGAGTEECVITCIDTSDIRYLFAYSSLADGSTVIQLFVLMV